MNRSAPASCLAIASLLALTSTALAQSDPAPRGASSNELWGVNPIGDVFRINLSTGAATPLFSIPDQPFGSVGGQPFYDPSTGRLAIRINDDAGIILVYLDPTTATVTGSTTISGLPPAFENTAVFDYSGTPGSFLTTIGPTGTFFEDRIARFAYDGSFIEISNDLGIGDNDGFAWDPFNNRSLVYDLNANDGFDTVFQVDNIFNIPTVTPIADTPRSNDVGQIAVHPFDGRLFVVGFDAGGGSLVEIVGDNLVNRGPFNAGGQIVGAAFVRESGCGPADVAQPLQILNAADAEAVIGFVTGGIYDIDNSPGSNIFDLIEALRLIDAGCP